MKNQMKSKTYFLIIFLTVVIVGLAFLGYLRAVPGADEQTDNRPQVEIIPASFDFGAIEYGAVAKHTFKLKNAGNDMLIITKVATSCGCTKAEVEKEEINPGEEIDLKVTYDTGVMTGAHGKGKQERIIYVKSNDPVNPQTEVIIRAVVKDR